MFKSQNNSSFSLDWINQIPSSIVIIDTDFKLISASPRWQANFELNLNDIEGKYFLDLFPELSQDLMSRLKYSLEGLRDIKFKYNAKNCKYSSKDSVWHLNPWKDGYGNIIGVIIKVESISKTQELEIELNKTKLILNQKSSVAKIGSWDYDVQNETLNWTSIVNKIYGLSSDFKPTLENSINFYVEESQEIIKKLVSDAINSGKPWNEKLQLKKSDGEVIWVNTIGRPKFKGSNCTRIIGTIQHIKNETKPNTEINDNILIEYPLFEKVPFGLAIVDFKNGNLLDVNEQFTKLTSFNKEHFIGHNFKKFIKDNIISKSAELKIQLEEHGSFKPVKFTYTNQKKHNINIKMTGTLVEGTSGIKSVLCTFENITSQTKLEKNLKNTIASAREKNEQLLNFAHMVSHNLKTHATNFSLLLNFLNDETGKNQRNKYMNMLFSASDNLSETIKGLREIVAVKSSINEEKKLLSLNESLFVVEQNVAGLLKETYGKIINEIPETTQVKALPAYLNSILTNCITNSIKYRSPDKKPIIILSIEESKNYTILSVEDNGLGIDLEKYGNQLFGLYKTFHRNKDSRGIGLYITKNQMEAMNGNITVESKPNEGTTFRFHFNKK
ncbi:PAS domain S-box-containing protein [Maribacter aquivivus]|uniref:histidine kinase n=1 Tax=Maribacter aquivivus TaxID=228958 RepID=A0A1M6VGU7_9FLAO|nr:PAS domain S-box protein [Maribacter aquivivus]SHK80574.1 PAS domain S-box-containing protein [Maribacter aquivivus]